MGDITDAQEAAKARARANRTVAATLPLLAEIKHGDLSERERAEKQQEVHRLLGEAHRETARVDAFYAQREVVGAELKRLLARKDPEVERLRSELKRVVERKGSDEREEIARIRAELERRRQELTHSDR
jgi:hypothetical protein